MYRIYFKQALQMLKQNPFISIISILGTALAIMMIMTVIVAGEIQNASFAPEINRDRTLYLHTFTTWDTITNIQNSNSTGIPYSFCKDYILPIKTPELIVETDLCQTIVKPEGSNDIHLLEALGTDADFWKLYSFTFVQGKPYSQEEFESGLRAAVLRERTARMLFKDENPIGKSMEVNFLPYRIVGVVKEISPLAKESNAAFWIPYTSLPQYENDIFRIMLLARDKSDFPKIKQEIADVERKYTLANPPLILDLNGPLEHRHEVLNPGYTHKTKTEHALRVHKRKTVLLFSLLLLVPALNLSGFSLSRLRKRLDEIGIRKAFGARRHVILIHVLFENLITTLIGGAIGLLFSYLAIFSLRRWLLEISADGTIPGQALVSFPVFLAVFVACLLLNLFSAGIPAYRVARMPIIDSLMQNDKK